MLLSFESPFAGASAVEIPGAMLRHCSGLVPAVLPESDWNMCKRTREVPQELGRSGRSLNEIPAGEPGDQLQALMAHSSIGERTERVNAEVPPSEGNEVRRDGRQEVVTS